MPRRKIRKQLADAPPEECFFVHRGPVVKNLRELQDILEKGISDEQFAYHVNKEKNDFSSWIYAVLSDKACAAAVSRARRRKTAARAVLRCLSAYEK